MAFALTMGRSTLLRMLCVALIATPIVGCLSREDQSTAEVTARELREHVEFLASDTLRGRETGTEEIAEAEQFIAVNMENAGLRPLPEADGYFLDFSLVSEGFDPGATTVSIDDNNAELELRPERDFRPLAFSPEGPMDGEIVFAGYGITAPEYGHDDYAHTDVDGKVVLLLRHEPITQEGSDRFLGQRYTRHSLFIEKARNAKAHGAIAMAIVSDPHFTTDPEDLRFFERYSFVDSPVRERERTAIPSIQLSQGSAALVLGIDLQTFGELQHRVDSGERVDFPGMRGKRITGELVARDPQETVSARNVAGYIPGRGGRWLILGAHHDHLGGYTGTGDTIFNGADDNASGTALILELADWFGRRATRPRWNIAFVTFSAEEVGLFGSRWFVASESIHLENVSLMINFDMIGRNPNEPLILYGDGFASGLTEAIESVAGTTAMNIDLKGREHEPFSDHDAFFRERIPFLMFHTDDHADYHATTDHHDLLDYGRMEAIGRFTIKLIEELSDSDTELEWIESDSE